MALPKATRRRIAEAAREQRAGKSDEEWEEHLLSLAEKQVKILNVLVQHNGPEGTQFRIQVKWGDEEWTQPEGGR